MTTETRRVCNAEMGVRFPPPPYRSVADSGRNTVTCKVAVLWESQNSLLAPPRKRLSSRNSQRSQGARGCHALACVLGAVAVGPVRYGTTRRSCFGCATTDTASGGSSRKSRPRPWSSVISTSTPSLKTSTTVPTCPAGHRPEAVRSSTTSSSCGAGLPSTLSQRELRTTSASAAILDVNPSSREARRLALLNKPPSSDRLRGTVEPVDPNRDSVLKPSPPGLNTLDLAFAKAIQDLIPEIRPIALSDAQGRLEDSRFVLTTLMIGI